MSSPPTNEQSEIPSQAAEDALDPKDVPVPGPSVPYEPPVVLSGEIVSAMSSPPTNDQSETPSQAAEDAVDPKDVPVPGPSVVPAVVAEPPVVLSSDIVSVPVVAPESEGRVAVSMSLSNNDETQSYEPMPLSKTWLLWANGIIDIVFGAYFAATTMVFRVREKRVDYDFARKPMIMDLMAVLCYMTQFGMGIGLIWGLKSTKKARAIYCLKAWAFGACFIMVEGFLFLFYNAAKIGVTYMHEATALELMKVGLGNGFYIFLRAFSFFPVGKFFLDVKYANSDSRQELHVIYRVSPPQQDQDQRSI